MLKQFTTKIAKAFALVLIVFASLFMFVIFASLTIAAFSATAGYDFSETYTETFNHGATWIVCVIVWLMATIITFVELEESWNS